MLITLDDSRICDGSLILLCKKVRCGHYRNCWRNYPGFEYSLISFHLNRFHKRKIDYLLTFENGYFSNFKGRQVKHTLRNHTLFFIACDISIGIRYSWKTKKNQTMLIQLFDFVTLVWINRFEKALTKEFYS